MEASTASQHQEQEPTQPGTHADLKLEDHASGHWSNFPSGLRVLVVDDDPLCLRVVEQMLKKCTYEVTTSQNATMALNLLRDKVQEFDLVLSDVYMPDMDGFKLLEVVGLEMDLPVIMMSSNGDTQNVLRGVTHGACDYLIKPVRLEELRNLWQHVVRRKRQHVPDLDSDEQSQEKDDDSSRKRKEAGGFPGSGSELIDRRDDDNNANKKARVVWSMEMHQQFVTAVNQLGIDKAVPKKILEIMNVDGLTRENVASHLQKYRLALKRVVGQQPSGIPRQKQQQQQMPTGVTAAAQQAAAGLLQAAGAVGGPGVPGQQAGPGTPGPAPAPDTGAMNAAANAAAAAAAVAAAGTFNPLLAAAAANPMLLPNPGGISPLLAGAIGGLGGLNPLALNGLPGLPGMQPPLGLMPGMPGANGQPPLMSMAGLPGLPHSMPGLPGLPGGLSLGHGMSGLQQMAGFMQGMGMGQLSHLGLPNNLVPPMPGLGLPSTPGNQQQQQQQAFPVHPPHHQQQHGNNSAASAPGNSLPAAPAQPQQPSGVGLPGTQHSLQQPPPVAGMAGGGGALGGLTPDQLCMLGSVGDAQGFGLGAACLPLSLSDVAQSCGSHAQQQHVHAPQLQTPAAPLQHASAPPPMLNGHQTNAGMPLANGMAMAMDPLLAVDGMVDNSVFAAALDELYECPAGPTNALLAEAGLDGKGGDDDSFFAFLLKS